MSGKSAVFTLYRMELKTLLRDRRAIVLSVVLPMLLMPLMLLISGRIRRSVEERASQQTYVFAIVDGPFGGQAGAGRAPAEAVRGRLRAVDRGEAADSLRWTRRASRAHTPLRTVEVSESDPASALREGRIDFYIEALTSEDAARRARDLRPRAPPLANGQEDDKSVRAAPDAPLVVIHYREDRPASRAAFQKVRSHLEDFRAVLREGALVARGFPLDPSSVLRVEAIDAATDAERSGARMGRFITALIVLFMIVGASSIAAGSVAGDRERGTLETLLSTGIARSDIIVAKILLVLTGTLVTTLVQVQSLYLATALDVEGAAAAITAGISAGAALLLLVLYLPLAVLVACVVVLALGFAKSYKEAQLYALPLTILGPVLALYASVPGAALRSIIAIVPLVNISVAAKEILLGKIDAPMIAVAWASTAAAAVQIARLAGRLLQDERWFLAAPPDAEAPTDGDARFRRSVIRWFAALWAIVLLASVGGAPLGVRGAIVFGQALFIAATLVLVRRYRLPFRAALAVRSVKPLVWPAVVLGAPAATVIAAGIFQLTRFVLPVPRSMLDQFNRSVLPDDIPTWQLFLLLAVVPPICEELTFRGLLLYGLRRRLHPIALCLTVGVVFGVFHIALFRLATTTFLGVLLTGLALLTGSVLPGIVWHAINNALPLIASRSGFLDEQLPVWSYPVATAVLAGCFFTLWKNRTPYPDLRCPGDTTYNGIW